MRLKFKNYIIAPNAWIHRHMNQLNRLYKFQSQVIIQLIYWVKGRTRILSWECDAPVHQENSPVRGNNDLHCQRHQPGQTTYWKYESWSEDVTKDIENLFLNTDSCTWAPVLLFFKKQIGKHYFCESKYNEKK
jgi:hypothetical protein